MAGVTVRKFAEQIRIASDRLLEQLSSAGVTAASEDDVLSEDDKVKLLAFLKGGAAEDVSKKRVTLKRKTTTEIKQTSKTGTAHTVHVERRRKRTFVKRAELIRQAEDEARKEHEEREQRLKESLTEPEHVDAGTGVVGEGPDAAAPVEAPPEAAVVEQEARDAAVEAIEAPDAVADDRSQTPDESVEPAPEADAREPAQESAAKDADQPGAVKPADAERRPERSRKKKKSKSRDQEREELHVSKAKRARRKKRGMAKPGSVKSSTIDQHGFIKPTAPVVREVNIPETVTVAELAQAMSVKAAEVIRKMMDMGSMITINQVLDRDTASVVVEEMGHVPKAASASDPEALLREQNPHREGEEKSRAPVVTVMGHVDHGKTSLLDEIRKSKVAAGEAGGITQHIGAYKVSTDRGDITFLDTPGHEAFSSMRARGAKVTDVVILVVAADDGVKPQTVEAIHHARDAGVPIVVAINKTDREEADAERVKRELIEHEVVPEELGGDTQMCPVSAHTGDGIGALLDAVSLQAEILELKANPNGPARGVVVEARLDRGRGPVTTVLVRAGCLRKGDALLAGRESGRVRALTDFAGKPIAQAGPSDPVEIQGLSGVPVAGDEVLVVSDERKAREIAFYRQGKHKEVKFAKQRKTKLENMFDQMGEGEARDLNLVVKADVHGSVEALTDALEKLSTDNIHVGVIHGMVGGINESDVNLAMASDAIIVAFNVRADAAARRLIENESVDVRYHNVIYDVVDEIKAAMTGLLTPIVKEQAVGLVEVREVFRISKVGAVAGCYVKEGVVKRNLPVRVLRDNVVIFDGSIDSLKRFKEDVGEVKSGFECGIGVRNYNDVKPGDQIEVYELIEEAPPSA